MNLVWTFDGVSIGSITMNRWEGQSMWTSGFGWLSNLSNEPDRPRPFQWEACVTALGWYVIITASTGKIGECQGATYNLPLEVAAAVRRLL